jgi:hypothetical protein
MSGLQTTEGKLPQPSMALVIYRMVPQSLSRAPRSFFEAGCEIIRRTHAPDPRVRHALPELAAGCTCDTHQPLAAWAMSCMGRSLSLGDHQTATELFDEIRRLRGEPPTPADMAAIIPDLWFGAGVPHGSWESLWASVGRFLLRFLVEQEERLGYAGFAMQTLDEIMRQRHGSNSKHILSTLRRIVRTKVHAWRCWF